MREMCLIIVQIRMMSIDGGEPKRLDPPGINTATHATRSKNGVISFDVVDLGAKG